MQLLQQIANDLDVVRREERQHVSVLERAVGRVRAIEALFRATDRAHLSGRQALEHLPCLPGLPSIDSGPAADVQLLPPTKPSDVDILSAAQVLVWRGVPALLAKVSLEVLTDDPARMVDVHVPYVPYVGTEQAFAAAMAAAGIGVAFMDRRVVYPLITERRALIEAPTPATSSSPPSGSAPAA